MAKRDRVGVCKLTGKHGLYVKSHIIPLSLTRLSKGGEKYVEAGIGLGVKTRFNSWYDGALVTKDGEEILAYIDSRALEELRLHRLVWSSWGNDQHLKSNDLVSEVGQPTYRLVHLPQPKVLRCFFVSLLWRAAASTRPEFQSVNLPLEDLEDLRHRVLNQNFGRPEDYPVQLFQVVTRGIPHNRTPLIERKRIPNIDLSEGPEITYVRFYFDGLVAHVHLARGIALASDYLNTCLGFRDETIVFTHEFERSRTGDNIREMVATVMREQRTPDTPLTPVAVAVQASLSRPKGPKY